MTDEVCELGRVWRFITDGLKHRLLELLRPRQAAGVRSETPVDTSLHCQLHSEHARSGYRLYPQDAEARIECGCSVPARQAGHDQRRTTGQA